ncbi:MAG: DUF2975 domain-containing protein [Eubacterium sp.]|nr:DUF2975 domain-containing protein [Eubacterium sp.]
MKTSKIIDRILKIVQGFLVAGVIVCAIFIPLTAVLGTKIIADASTVELGGLNIVLAGDYHNYLDLSGIKMSIIIVLITAIISCAVAWLCLRKIRDILSPMKEGRPFEEGISKNIRQLALIILVGGGIAEAGGAIGQVFTIKAYNLATLFNNAAIDHATYDYNFSLWFIIVALILFFLSYVFRYGEELQKESDETL